MPASPAWWLRLVRLGGCYLLGLIAVGLLLVALLMTGQFRVVALWQASGLPLALLLERQPGEFWQALLGSILYSLGGLVIDTALQRMMARPPRG